MEKYEQLLESVYEKIPSRVAKQERFEFPEFFSVIEGSQTIIKNLVEVADKLRRPPEHLLKYLSKELATSANQSGRRAVLQGRFKSDQVNSRLSNYIKEYVLCNECGKPDTSLTTFQGVKYKRCEVCGARAPVKAI